MSPFQQRATEIVRDQQAAYDAEWNKRRGVSGAMDSYWPLPEAVDDVAERLAVQHERAAAFRASPRGRFYRVIGELAGTGAYETEVHRLRGFYDRSISLLNSETLTPEGVVAVAECVAILNGIVGRDARAGVDALTDLLRSEAPGLGEAA